MGSCPYAVQRHSLARVQIPQLVPPEVREAHMANAPQAHVPQLPFDIFQKSNQKITPELEYYKPMTSRKVARETSHSYL
ncbi:hypothetical protein Nepgr_019377 [Nepenthes gracilis]|uniref:Uncharacterized protein n=1 Tax=Nepenthes gracilis TaxID=150966 RepID=A0AAD3XV94_NEPGR|nr:hypothetical protein Nepgr_019377 [Nepenthes gracilis]